MVRDIIKGEHIFTGNSEKVTVDEAIILEKDLTDTLNSNKKMCVGMAANMIGSNKAAIIVLDEYEKPMIMFNPQIIRKNKKYETEEACLSLEGSRKTTRFQEIYVTWDMLVQSKTSGKTELQKRVKNFDSLSAQIIQHEVDHLNGIVV